MSKDGAFSGVDLDVGAGEIVGVAGLVGCGKTELARSIVGIERPDDGVVELLGEALRSGDVALAIRRGSGYVSAERTIEGVIPDHSVAWNMMLPNLQRLRVGRLPVLRRKRERQIVSDWIERLRIRSGRPEASCATLSGGNQQKVVFARWLTREPRLLVLDDPGRGLDVGAKEEIYSLLRDMTDHGVGILLISDNLPELIGLSNRILVMRDHKLTAELPAPTRNKPRERDVVRHML